MKRIPSMLTGSVAIGALWAIAACGGAESADPQEAGESGLDPADGVAIHIQATTADFPHADGLSSMTAHTAGGAIRSLSLLSLTLFSCCVFAFGPTQRQTSSLHGMLC